ncbi:MAG: hypothetical protein H6582_01105 [Crocinitomicaceae bacterium]|nr:hypothetical protein [Crocinitomicaceae bacterium]
MAITLRAGINAYIYSNVSNYYMGVCLFLETSTGSTNSSICFRKFYDDVIQSDSEVIPHKQILSDHQIELIAPQLDEEVNFNAIDPKEFLEVIQLIHDYIEKNNERLPMFHWFIKPNGSKTGSSDIFHHNGNEVYLNGIHNNSQKRDYVQLRMSDSLAKEYQWIAAKPVIEFDGIRFDLYSKTMLETYNDELNELMAVCNYAITHNEGVIWSVSF